MQYNSGFNLKPEDYSDIGQAKVLAREYGGELVYTDATDYMRYDGVRWAESKQLALSEAPNRQAEGRPFQPVSDTADMLRRYFRAAL